MPPQFQEFFKLPDLLTAIELKLAITGSTTAELVLHARDEPSAAEAERLVNHALQIAREMALASMAETCAGRIKSYNKPPPAGSAAFPRRSSSRSRRRETAPE